MKILKEEILKEEVTKVKAPVPGLRENWNQYLDNSN